MNKFNGDLLQWPTDHSPVFEFPNTGGTIATGWYAGSGANGYSLVSRRTIPLSGEPGLPAGTRYAVRFQWLAGYVYPIDTSIDGPDADPRWGTFIEYGEAHRVPRTVGVRLHAGKTVRYTIYVRTVGNINMGFRQAAWQSFGTGGGQTAWTGKVYPGQIQIATPIWQQFTDDIALPSVTGKNLGANGDDYLGYGIQICDGAANTWEFAMAEEVELP